MELHAYDLDETLIAVDSCSLFCEFLRDKDLVNHEFVQKDQQLMRQYAQGYLKQEEYIEFFIGALTHLSISQIQGLMPEFLDQYVEPVIYPEARAQLQQQIQQSHQIVIVSATAEFIVQAIAQRLGVNHVLAIEIKRDGDYLMPKIFGIPSYQEGKVLRLKHWINTQQKHFESIWAYSDSINDLPLLSMANHAVATNPDKALEQIALKNGWPIVNWQLPPGYSTSNETPIKELYHE